MSPTTSQSLRGPRCPQYRMSAPDTTAHIAVDAATPNHIRCSLQEAFTIARVLRSSFISSVATFSRNEPSEGPRFSVGVLINRFRPRHEVNSASPKGAAVGDGAVSAV